VAERFEQHQFALSAEAVEVVLVRHGASAALSEGESFALFDGHGDPPLSRQGEIQARAVAARLAHEPLAGLFTTGLRRTNETAAPLAQLTGLEPVELPELREVRLGDWEGGEFRIRTQRRDPLAVEVLVQERWDVIPNAETMESLAQRVRAGVDAIVSAVGSGVAAAAVVHGGVIGELCRQATLSRPFAFIHADNGSITRLVVLGDGRWLLRSFNDTAHLG
jgi:2,3-bisphosphoglycerate-dependent phosphoglycerate mutase